MAISNSIENFQTVTNEEFVEKADKLRPELIKTAVSPKDIIDIYMGENDWE